MEEGPTWDDGVDSQDSWSSTDTPMDPRGERDAPCFLMGSLFCNGKRGEIPLEQHAKSRITFDSGNKSSERKSRNARMPLQSTDVLNKGVRQETMAIPPSSDAACFESFLHGRKGACSQSDNCAGSCGACVSCWDSNSNHPLISSIRLTTPASSSIPVIEALGVTPKSKERRSKYNVSGGAMIPPGNSFPAPAPRKKYTSDFCTVSESTMRMPTEGGTSLTVGVEDSLLPEAFRDVENMLYTEAELEQRVQEALAEKQKEFASLLASHSEDSDLHYRKDLEQQGMLWNKDLQERLEASRSHYKKKQSILKSRIFELEGQCQKLQKRQLDDRWAHERQLKELQVKWTSCKQANETERTKLLKQIAVKNEELSRLDNDESRASQQESHCTQGVLRDLQHKVRTLQSEKKKSEERAKKLEKHVISLEGSLSNHISALSSCKDGRKLDQRKIVELENKVAVMVETQDPKNEPASRDEDDFSIQKSLSSQEKVMDKVKSVLRHCSQSLSLSGQNSIAMTPSDEKDSLDLSLEALEIAVNEIVRRLAQAEATTKCAVDARVEAEVEGAKLMETIENKTKQVSRERELGSEENEIGIRTLKSYWEQKATGYPQGEGPKQSFGNRATLQSEALNLLKRDIASLQKLCQMEPGPAKELLEDYASELHKKVEQISDELQIMQHQLLRCPDVEMPPVRTNTCILEYSVRTKPGGAHAGLLQHVAGLEVKLAYAKGELSQKEEAEANLEKENAEVIRALGASQVQVERLGEQVKHLLVVRNVEESTSEMDGNPGGVKEETQVKEVLVILEMKQENEKLNDKVREQEEENVSLRQVREEMTAQMTGLKETNEEMTLQVLCLTEAKDEMTQQVSSLKQASEEMMGQVSGLTEANEKMTEQVSRLKQANEDMTEQVSRLTEANGEMTKQLSTKEGMCETLTSTLDERREQIESLTADKMEAETQLRDLRAKCGILAQALDEQKEEAASLNKEKQELGAYLAHLTEKYNALTKNLDEKGNKLIRMARGATKSALEQNFIKNRLDCIIDLIERRDDGDDFIVGSTAMEVDHVEPDSFQKLDRIEHRLRQAWKEFVQMTRSQRELLSGPKEKIASLKSQSDETTLDLSSRISDLEHDVSEKKIEIEASKSTIAVVKGGLSEAFEDASSAHTKHAEALQISSKQLKELKAENERLSQQVTALETRLENVDGERGLEAATNEEIEQSRATLETARAKSANLQVQLDAASSESSKLTCRIFEVESLLETNSAECRRLDELLTNKDAIEEELLRKSAELEKTSSATIARCEAQVRQVRDEHAKEIDELLGQLDLVEAEHQEDCREKEKMAKENDAIIAALGTQLAESQGSINSLKNTSSKHKREIDKAREEIFQAKNDTEHLKVQLANLQETHTDFLEKREEAIEAVREETIQEATVQFDNFNALYRTMTSNYKSAALKVQELEAELRGAKNALEEINQEHFSTVASIKSELAQLRTAHTKEDAATARTLKEHQEMERALQIRLSEAEMNNRSAQQLLATIVAEKEDLIAENEELKSVCEEAMSLAETHHS